MSTKHIVELDEGGFDIEKWMTESLPRGFGICDTFRDSGEMTKEEILKALEEGVKTAEEYHEKELNKAIHKLERLRFFQREQWRDELKKFNVAKFEYADKENEKRNKIRKEHAQTRMTLLNLVMNNSISEITRNIALFGLEQLDATKEDEKRYTAETYAYADIEEFKKKILEKAQWDVNYYKKRMVEEKKTKTEQLKEYRQLLKDMGDYFKHHPQNKT